MSEPIAAPGSPYNTEIPELSENADIQTALRYYHYGENTNDITEEELNPNSMAGHLKALESSKVGKTPSTITDAANLNEYTETGYYHQANSTWANNGTGYPRINSISYAGMLKVVAIGDAVYQEYHMSGAPSSNTVIFYRAKLAGASWPASWTQYVSLPELNTSLQNYYTKTESNLRHLVLGESTSKSDISSTPTTGDILIFNGTKWVNGIKGYSYVDRISLTGSTSALQPPTYLVEGEFNKADYPWLRAIKVIAVGGGGGGASGTSDGAYGGGGAGAYVEHWITDIASLDSSIFYAAGNSGWSWDSVNSTVYTPVVDGVPSYFGEIVFAAGGKTNTLNNLNGANGGAAADSSGDFKVDGGDGGVGEGGVNQSGYGGASFFGGGARGRTGEGNGNISNVFGAGGSGSVRNNGTKFGGRGAPGLIILELYA